MSESENSRHSKGDEASSIPVGAEQENPLAWEMIEAGRYMPRRIRGSFRGRVLG